MSRIGKLLAAALLLVPAVAQAQRPGNTVQTRSAELYLDRGERASVAEDKAKFFKQAIEVAQEGIEKQPDNAKTWFVLGKVHAAMGNATAADSAFDRAEQMWPDYVEETDPERMKAYVTAFNEGVQAIQANDNANAIKHLEAAFAVYPKKPTAVLNLGSLYARANDAEKAADAYRRALAVMRGEYRKGIAEAEEKQWTEWEENAAFNLAQILATTQKDEEAVKAYEEYLAKYPDNNIARGNLAVVYTRMGRKDDAAKVYQDLLSRDLTDEEYFQVGVGLFRGEAYAEAAAAFRKAIEKNPAFRDAYYNLAQATYEQTMKLEDARSKAKVTEQKSYDAKLKPLLEELQMATEKVREMDPHNRNVLALLARAYRGIADVVDAKSAAEWKNKTLKVMESHRDMPYEVTNVMLTPEEGGFKLTGNFVNLKAAEGTPKTITFTFLGKDGSVITTETVTVNTPKVEEQVEFTTTLKTDAPLGGWKYTIS